MKTNRRNHLSCAIFGHNLVPISSQLEDFGDSNIFICKTCNVKMVMDASGNFEELPYKNNQIGLAIRKLFLLNRKTAPSQLSI
ncbi:MAG: hypothetical protein AAF688_08020 [Bacteroidota bacterium]